MGLSWTESRPCAPTRGEDLGKVSISPTLSPGTVEESDQADALLASAAVGLRPPLPVPSNETSVVLDRNALGVLCAHWRLMSNDAARAGASFPRGGGQPLPVLRLIRIHPAGDSERVAEVALAGVARAGAGDSTFPVSSDQGRYCAELGLTRGDGAWLMLARSNELHQMSRAGAERAETHQIPGPPAVRMPRPLPQTPSITDPEPALALHPPGHLDRVFPLAAPPVRLRHPGEPAVPPVQTVPTGPITTDVIQVAPITQLAYGQPPGGVEGILVEAELRITGQAPPGSLIDLYGYPYRIGAGGRFQLVLRIDDPTLLRRALELHPPPELTLTRDP